MSGTRPQQAIDYMNFDGSIALFARLIATGENLLPLGQCPGRAKCNYLRVVALLPPGNDKQCR